MGCAYFKRRKRIGPQGIFLNIGFRRVVRIDEVSISAVDRLPVVCGESNPRQGMGYRLRLSVYIPKA